MNRVLLPLRVFLGVLLLYSGFTKVYQPYDFLASVFAYGLTGPTIGLLVAAVLPWLEIVVGGCLMTGILAEGAFLGAVILAATFTFATASAWHRGLAISCGCFGHGGDTISGQTVLRAGALLALAAVGFALCCGNAHCKSAGARRKSTIKDDPTRGGSLMAGPAADRPRLGRVFGRA